MKTPEEIADDCMFASNDKYHLPRPAKDMRAHIAAAIAAERQRADALAEALRKIAEMTVDPKMQPAQWKVNCCNAVALTALAAYEAQS